MSHKQYLNHTALATAAIAALLSCPATRAFAQDQPAATRLPDITVTADKPKPSATASGLTTSTLSGPALTNASVATGDTAAMLERIPGLSSAVGGGVSSLPVLDGFADDRLNILTFGMAITSFCANHMNPPLSYADPSRVGSVEVLNGIVPVSKGGDAIGGTIIVEPKAPDFAAAGKGLVAHGGASVFYRSNGDGFGGSGFASLANQDWSLRYDGSYSKSGNYKTGGGGTVLSSLYAAQNHSLTLAHRLGNGTLTFNIGVQDIPYQGFPNVYMDMIYNRSIYGNARYEGTFDWGKLDARVFANHTDHYMNFLADKNGGTDATTTTGMPMYTRGNDLGWSVKGDIALGKADTLRIGNEFHHATLDDWWPPVTGMGAMMMGPGTFQNVNGATRDRLGTFAEWEHSWSSQWSTLLGLRNDTVWMNTGNVVGYNAMYAKDAAAFNASSHAKTDVNFDLTALTRYKPTEAIDTEFGYSRKTRSPNFYERYAWSTGMMASSMISWFGDTNGYVGNLNLKPEVAHTISGSFGIHDPTRRAWEFKITPYYSYVENFIDVDYLNAAQAAAASPILRFANHNAELWGVDASGRSDLWTSATYGKFGIGATASYTHGRDLVTHDGLYRMMPLNGRITLDHALGDWGNQFDVQLVSAKTDVSAMRREDRTPSYALFNYATHYQWKNVRLDLGVTNIFDKRFYSPLAGVDYSDWNAAGGSGRPGPLPGQGRSVFAAMSVTF